MKIGAFAKHNKTSIDTIRHYMALDLIVPEKLMRSIILTQLVRVILMKSINLSPSDLLLLRFIHLCCLGALVNLQVMISALLIIHTLKTNLIRSHWNCSALSRLRLHFRKQYSMLPLQNLKPLEPLVYRWIV